MWALLMNLNVLAAEPKTFSSGAQQTLMIELFTSEGCSSCPPADRFLNQFKDSDMLWQSHIPMAFHVDYWDNLGWHDRFAKAAYSDRQRIYRKQGHSNGVYTPGFVVNGKEWTGFFKPWRSLPEAQRQPGVLTASLDGQQVHVEFNHAQMDSQFHLAILGMGLQSNIRAGENQGHLLTHDFVVLNHQQQSGNQRVSFTLPLIVEHQPDQFAVVTWLTEGDQLPPIQATGGYLPAGTIRVMGAGGLP